MKNYKRRGAVKTFTSVAAVEGGQPVAIGDRAGVAMGAYLASQEGEYLQGGVCEFAKKAALAITPGIKLGYDISAKEVVLATDPNSDFDLGEADAAAAGADTTCDVLVNTMPYILG